MSPRPGSSYAKPRRMYGTTCERCQVAVRTPGKGHPRYEIDKPIREHQCPETPVTTDFFGLDEVPRDRWDRPLIQPVGGGDLEPYTRVSTFAGALSDAGGLTTWKARNAALAMARYEDLAALAASLTFSTEEDDAKRKRADKPVNKKLDSYIETGIQRVADNAAYGTAIHAFTEPNGSPHVPARMRPDVDSYSAAIKAHGITVLETELFVVNDEWKVAGTVDHLYDVPGLGVLAGDKKTGKMKAQEVAIQLRSYAGAKRYDYNTGARSDLGARTDIGLLVHIPKSKGATAIYVVDLTVATQACAAAVWVRTWRERDDLLTHLTPFSAVSDVAS